MKCQCSFTDCGYHHGGSCCHTAIKRDEHSNRKLCTDCLNETLQRRTLRRTTLTKQQQERETDYLLTRAAFYE